MADEKPKDPVETPQEPIKEEHPNDMLDRADRINKRMETNFDREEEILRRREALATRDALGGKSSAGQAPEKKKKLTDKEYAEKIERGEIPGKDE